MFSNDCLELFPQKISVLDFFQKNIIENFCMEISTTAGSKNSQEKFLYLQTGSTVVEKFVLDDLRLNLKKYQLNANILSSEDLKKDWIEENFLNLSLFSSLSTGDSVPSQCLNIVLNAQEVPKDIWEFLASPEVSKYVGEFLFIGQKEWKSGKKSKSKKTSTQFSWEDHYHQVQFLSPKFFEGDKILRWLLPRYGFKFSSEVVSWILDKVENSIEELMLFLGNFSQHYALYFQEENQKPFVVDPKQLQLITLQGSHGAMIEDILKKSLIHGDGRLDLFKLLDVFNHSPRNYFYQLAKFFPMQFSVQGLDSKPHRELPLSVVYFMSSHLQKAIDHKDHLSHGTALVAGKNQYERQILKTVEKFSREDLFFYLKIFMELEIQLKSTHESFERRIRELCMP